MNEQTVTRVETVAVTSRPTAIAVYLDPLLYVLATIAVLTAFTFATLPLEQQHSAFVIFWDNVRWQAAGHDLYTAPPRFPGDSPNLAAPALLVLTAPLTMLPIELAQIIWIAIGVACYALSAYWIGHELQLPVGRILSILLICPATVIALSSGSFTAPLTLLVTRAWREHRRQREISAGLGMGAALFCKPFLLPFLGYAIIRRDRRLCLGLLAGMAAALMAGIGVFGVANTALWLQTLPTVPPAFIASHFNGAWMGWLTRAGLIGTARFLWWVVGAVSIGALLVWRWRQSDDNNVDAVWLGAMTGGLLASPAGWHYYAPLLVAPFTPHRSLLRWIGYALFCLPWNTLTSAQTSPLAWRLTVGSAYFWGFLVLFIASLVPTAQREGED